MSTSHEIELLRSIRSQIYDKRMRCEDSTGGFISGHNRATTDVLEIIDNTITNLEIQLDAE